MLFHTRSDVFLVLLCVFVATFGAQVLLNHYGPGVSPWVIVGIAVASVPVSIALVAWKRRRDRDPDK